MAEAAIGSESSGLTGAPQLALRLARSVHLGQHRKQTHEQYVQHPIAVAKLLDGAGYGYRVITAAYLHDVVEKTDVEVGEIEARFGLEVAVMVSALSENPGIPGYVERKRELRERALSSGADVAAIYAADRLANVRDWLTLEAPNREPCAERLGTSLADRLDLWEEDLQAMRKLEPEPPFLGEFERGLARLRTAG